MKHFKINQIFDKQQIKNNVLNEYLKLHFQCFIKYVFEINFYQNYNMTLDTVER